MVLLAAEHRLTAPAIAAIVREDDQTVRNWLKRYLADLQSVAQSHRNVVAALPAGSHPL